MRTKLVNNIAHEAIYQLQYYENLYLTRKKNNKIFSIVFSTKIICLIAFHVYICLKF